MINNLDNYKYIKSKLQAKAISNFAWRVIIFLSLATFYSSKPPLLSHFSSLYNE